MKDSMPSVAVINRSDSTGGAAVVSLRLVKALRDIGVDARMLVEEKLTDLDFVSAAAPHWRAKIPFLSERLGIFAANGFNRRSLFKIDTATAGLPLWRNPLVLEADIICLNWVNQGMLSLHGLRKLLQLGKPIVWTMHDMWNLTGVCHHAGECDRYLGSCGSCPLFGKMASDRDISHLTFRKKEGVYSLARNLPGGRPALTFVAVSRWVADLAARSPLLGEMPVKVIPNAFPTDIFPMPEEVVAWRAAARRRDPSEFILAMGAARLDDSVKGSPLLVEATRRLRDIDPDLARRTRLITFGGLKNPDAFEGLGVKHTHLGTIAGAEAVRDLLRGADVVVSSSLYETLPGTLVEGQACGAIPVSFDRGGQRDIVDHLSTGYIAHMQSSPAESAKNLAEGFVWASRQTPDIAERLADNVARRFSADAVAGRYLELFRSLLS